MPDTAGDVYLSMFQPGMDRMMPLFRQPHGSGGSDTEPSRLFVFPAGHPARRRWHGYGTARRRRRRRCRSRRLLAPGRGGQHGSTR